MRGGSGSLVAWNGTLSAALFFEQRVEESVVIVLSRAVGWQELPLAVAPESLRPRQRATHSVRMPRAEVGNRHFVLLGEHRARRIEQSAAGLDRLPKRVQQPVLLL